MNDERSYFADSDEQLDKVIAEYILAIEESGPQVQDVWLKRYPQHEAGLLAYFTDHAQIMKWIEPPPSTITHLEPTRGYEPLSGERFETREPSVGDTIGRQFRVADVKQGGMGRVYVVRAINDCGTQPRCVLKSVLSFQRWRVRHVGDSESRLVSRYAQLLFRFRREAMYWVRLADHANIARALGVFEITGRPYLLLEYADSGDLGEWIHAGRLSLSTALDFAMQFCAGMIHAVNSAGLTHRDIKPANVLIHQGSTIKISDLGLARAWVDSEPLAMLEGDVPRGSDMSYVGGGTRAYMAPEQFHSLRDADTRSDIFSFGAMLFEMLTGQQLFRRTDAREAAVTNLQLPVAHELNPAVPPLVSTIVSRCVAYDREARYTSFEHVAKQIARTGLVQKTQIVSALASKFVNSRPAKRDWNREVWSLLSLGQFSAAEQLSQNAVRNDPTYHGHWLNRGKALAELKRYSEAHQCYARAAELNPRDVQCWFNVAYALVVMGRAEEGLRAAEKAIEVDASCSEAWDAAGCCRDAVFGPRDAVGYFRRATKIGQIVGLGGENWRAWNNLGRCLTKLGQDDEALTCFQKAVELNPSVDRAWFEIACILGAKNQFAAALNAVNKNLQFDQQHGPSWSLRGLMLSQIASAESDLQQARHSFRKAIELDPNDTVSATLLGQLETRMGH